MIDLMHRLPLIVIATLAGAVLASATRTDRLRSGVQSGGEIRVGEEPVVTLVADAGSRDELVRVISAFRLSNGSIAVADAGAYEVRIYDRQGRILHRTGRKGKGPGEF